MWVLPRWANSPLALREREIPGERERVRAALGASRVLLSTLRTVRFYGETVAALQRLGQPIPVNDVWNAALALEHDVPLLADDSHFSRVPGLKFIPIR